MQVNDPNDIYVHPYYRMNQGKDSSPQDSTVSKTANSSLKVLFKGEEGAGYLRGVITFPSESPIRSEEGVFIKKEGKYLLHGKGIRSLKNGVNHIGTFEYGKQIDGDSTLTIDTSFFVKSSL